tara:strand:+ start:845 stop:1198 length:354 start_codon:yes stop_codon:yes gene_type:complete
MPKLKNKSRQYLFKNKLNIKRKSRIELMKESFFMMTFGFLLLFLIYIIPQKVKLFNSFNENINIILNNILEILFYSFEILITLLICFALLVSITMIIGSLTRIFKILQPKSRKINLR